MKQFGLRFLYKHLGQALKEMPFEITNHNKVVAVVSSPEYSEPLVKEKNQAGTYKSSLLRFFSNGGKKTSDTITNEWENELNDFR